MAVTNIIDKLLASGIQVLDISEMSTWTNNSVTALNSKIIASWDTPSPGDTEHITLTND